MFLVPDDSISQSHTVGGLGCDLVMRATESGAVNALGIDPQPPLELWLIGYIDYRDQFGTEHRAGFGRYYDRAHRVLTWDERTASLLFDRPLTTNERRRYN